MQPIEVKFVKNKIWSTCAIGYQQKKIIIEYKEEEANTKFEWVCSTQMKRQESEKLRQQKCRHCCTYINSKTNTKCHKKII